MENNDHIQKNINRCFKCNKKIGLFGIQCRCKYVFCNKHKYYNEHNCNFDYKTYSKSLLEKSNIKISSIKLDKI